MRHFFVFLSILSAFAAKAPAQTLFDVIASLSDRQRVLVQRDQIRIQLGNDYADGSNALPGDDPINWVGVGTDPSESAVNGLGIGSRVALLNQAVAEFDRLAPAYANMSPAELQGAGPAGTIAFHRSGDFTPLPRATPENQQVILRLLAQRVRALRVLLWPSAFETTSFSASTDVWEEIQYDENDHPSKVLLPEGTGSVTWKPAQVGAANLSVEEGGSSFYIGFTAAASVSVGGSYYEDPSTDEGIAGPLREQLLSFSGNYAKRAAVRATAQGAEGTQIGGTVKILSRSRWNQLSVDGAPSRFNPANGSFVIEGGGASGDVALFAAPPGTNVSGAWVTTASGSDEYGPYLDKHFVETGYQLKAASILAQSDPGYSDAFQNSYERNWTIGCRFFSLFLPDFTRGVDAAAARAKIDAANLVLATNSLDGAMLLHPRPNLLFGIEIGPGLNGAGDGMLTAGTMADALENDWSSRWNTGWTYGQVGGDSALVNRFDSSYALRFAGSAADYHVVYDNNRSGRTQSLPQLDWSYTDEWFGASHDRRTLYEAWDSPRLKQVVGRDLIADITYNASHYGGYTVTVFRRPENAADPVAGQAVATENLSVVRTWTFSKPGAGTTAHPADAENLQAQGLGNEKFEIGAVHTLPNCGAGWDIWYDYAYGLWGGSWTTAWWWYLEGDYKWILKLSDGLQEKCRKEIAIETTNRSSDPWIYDFVSATTVSTFLDGTPVGVLSSESLDPFGDAVPADWQYVAAGKTIVGSPTPADADDRAFRYGKLPTALAVDYDGVQPDAAVSWDAQGLMADVSQGPWKTEGSLEASAYKITRKLNNQTIATDWVESTGPATIKHYSAPDGAHGTKGDSAVAWTEVQTGDLSTGSPGLPHKVTRSDGTGATFAWAIGTDGAGTVVAADGLMAGGSVTRGRQQTTSWNARGFTSSASTDLLLGGTVKTAGAAVPSGEFTAWAMPKKWKDDFSDLLTSWGFQGNRSLIASVTTPLGLTTGYAGLDVLDRPTSVSANNITATHTFAGTGVTTDYAGTDIQAGTQSATDSDTLGRLTSSNTTWNGVPDNLGLTYGSGTVGVSRTAGPYGTHSASVRQDDGSVSSASGPTLAFGGTTGDSLSVSSGRLVSKTAIADAPGTYQETHTDAWGRVCKVITPSRSGTGATQAGITYTNPDSTLLRVITTEPSGRILITESDPFDASGAVSRSGIDVNGNGSLGATDRYTESLTKVVGTKVTTTVMVTENNGLREILSTEWTPSTGITVTKANGNEETITATPNYANKSVTTSSSKGWSNTRTVNNLGLSTGSTLSGTGIPTTELNPVWRADGSLASVELTIGGESNTAAFNPDGTLSSLTVPGKGNILGSHTIANGVESLAADGVTVERKLDDTQVTASGADIIGKADTLAVSGSGYQETVHPAVGANTTTNFNAAGVATGKSYAAGPGESYGYLGELLTSVSLARGGQLDLGYSPDGAKDLTSAVWPTMVSGTGPDAFTIPAVTHGFGHDRAGRVDGIGDASGSRSLAYQNGRLQETAWSTGPLAGYRIVRSLDQFGRDTGFTLYRGSVVVHSAQQTPDGDSDQVSALASGALKVVPQRDAAGRITGYLWGNSTGNFIPVVTQTWQRGVGGRIEVAASDVAGAPTFTYLIDPQNPGQSFDTRGRRLKCATAAGTWTYVYTNGQLTSATHPTLGTFAYQFDGIGRRTDMGTENTTDLLNRTLAWTNSQNKTLTVKAAQGARVWINGSEVQNFNGSYSYAVPTPGQNGGWVEWNALAVLAGQGEGAGTPPANPHASPDAKAELSGAAWVPPVSEALAYDSAGNRESSALWDYGWDGRNQLVRARTKNYKTAAQGFDITCDYDVEGRRFKKFVTTYQNGSIVSQDHMTFIWDGWDMIYELHQNPSGLATLERKYMWGPDLSGTHGGAGGAGGLLLIRETRGTQTKEYYPLYDGCGHVIALADSNGVLVAEYAYGPFGELIHAKGPMAQINPIRYATKYYDSEMGLYYFGGRYLDPITGQWTCRELLGESESLNRYSYCHNDPVNKVDVQGLAEFDQDTAESQRKQLFAESHLMGSVDSFRVNQWAWNIPFINKQILFTSALGEYRRNGGYSDSGSMIIENGVSPGGFNIVTKPVPTVSEKTDAIMTGVYKGTGAVVAAVGVGVVVVGVLPESVLTSGAVVATGKVLLVLGVVDGTGRIIKYVPVLVDKNATPYQLTQAVENSMIGASEVLPGTMLIRNGQSGQRLGTWWRSTLAELNGGRGLATNSSWRNPSGAFCFPAGTLVLMADGSRKPIETIESGDNVLAADPSDSEPPRGKRVTRLHHNWTERLIYIDLDRDGDGTCDGQITATGEHPFWTCQRQWVNAKDLIRGDLLLDDKGQRVHVLSSVSTPIITDTYNLSVEGTHTFFACAGTIPILVHNTDFSPPIISEGSLFGELFQGIEVYGPTSDTHILGRYSPGTGDLRVNWVHVTPELRGQGVQGQLYDRLFFAAERLGPVRTMSGNLQGTNAILLGERGLEGTYAFQQRARLGFGVLQSFDGAELIMRRPCP